MMTPDCLRTDRAISRPMLDAGLLPIERKITSNRLSRSTLARPKHSKRFLRILIATSGCLAKPLDRCNAKTIQIQHRNVALGHFVALISSLAQPAHGLGEVLRHAHTVDVEKSDVVLCLWVALFRCLAIPMQRGGKVLLHALPVGIKMPERDLSRRVAFVGSDAIPACGLSVVFLLRQVLRRAVSVLRGWR